MVAWPRWPGRSAGCHVDDRPVSGWAAGKRPAPARWSRRGRRPFPHAARGGYAISFTVALGPLFCTEAMPPSRAASLPYIWLVPMTWWLAAFRVK